MFIYRKLGRYKNVYIYANSCVDIECNFREACLFNRLLTNGFSIYNRLTNSLEFDSIN